MSAGKNDNTDDLKRERRSLSAKIERRKTAIQFARRDIYDYERQIAIINRLLADRQPARSRSHDR